MAAVVVLLSQLAPAADPDASVGKFVGENITLELKPAAAPGALSGELEFKGKKFPVTARATNEGVAGTFQSGGDSFEFTAALDGNTMKLSSGGSDYVLKKSGTNPLARPQAANPLAGGPKDSPAEFPAPAASASPARGSQMKDPLAYKMQELPGGSIATFDGWKSQEVMNENNTYIFDTSPEGRQKEFVLRVAISTPSAQDLQNFFTFAPPFVKALLQQLSPTFQSSGEPRKTKCGGDEAYVEEYTGNVQGTKYNARALYVKRKDVGIVTLGIGTDAGFKEFGRSVEIVAQSITFKESQLNKELIGSWVFEASSRTDAGGGGVLNVNSARTITIMPNGTFTDSATTTAVHDDGTGLAQGGSRGTVIQRGNILTFHYDSGQTWSPAFQVGGGGLKLDGQLFLKQ